MKCSISENQFDRNPRLCRGFFLLKSNAIEFVMVVAIRAGGAG
jgi:hypothetical protein